MARIEENSPMGSFLRQVFPKQFLRAASGCCVFCNKPVNADSFRDEISRNEFGISGVCQSCQDETFQE